MDSLYRIAGAGDEGLPIAFVGGNSFASAVVH